MTIVRTIALTALLLLLAACHSSADTYIEEVGDGVYWTDTTSGSVVVLAGTITETKVDEVLAIIHADEELQMVALLQSEGGQVLPAYRLGRAIKARGLYTLARGYCYSACVDVLAAGNISMVYSDTVIGLHAPSRDTIETRERDLRYYADINMIQMYGLTYSTPNDKIKKYSATEARDLGIISTIIWRNSQ